MARQNRRTQAAQEEIRRKKMFRFLFLPALVLLLIIFIIIADRVKHGKTNAGTTAAQAETLAPGERKSGEDGSGASGGSAAETEAAPYDYAHAELTRNTEPGIDRLVSSYLDAQCKGDADAMLRLFGRSEAEGTEELRAEIAAGRKLYDTFENTLIYTVPGVNDGDYIVYVLTQAWFRKVDTPAPMLLRAYAVSSGGQYYFRMDEDLTAEQAEALRLADGSEAVQKINNENRTALAKAIVSDAKLGSVYEKLREGAAEASAAAESTAAEAAAESSAAQETVEEAVVEVNVDPAAASDAGAEQAADAGGAENAAESAGDAAAESPAESSAAPAESIQEAEVSVETTAQAAEETTGETQQ